MILLAEATIIDGTGSLPVAGQCVFIQDGRIMAIRPEMELDLPAEGIERVDLAGATLLPGFIDCHVHIAWQTDIRRPFRLSADCRDELQEAGAVHARQTLEAGFTTIRDLMSVDEAVFGLRDDIRSGQVVGPRIVASGRCITVPGGHGTQMGEGNAIEVEGGEGLLRAVENRVRAGADVIKIMVSRAASSPQFRESPAFLVEDLRPAVDAAHGAGLRVCAHVHTLSAAIEAAVCAGIDSIEHGAPADDRLLAEMADRGAFLVPTLSVGLNVRPEGEPCDLPFPDHVIAWMRRLDVQTRDTVRRAHRLGVPIALGTDAGAPKVSHGANAREFGLLVECGLSPMEAIVAGTRQAAANLGLGDDLGTIEVGKRADLVAVEGNPAEEISLLACQEKVLFVMRDGMTVVDRR